jgi:hypothetical protein
MQDLLFGSPGAFEYTCFNGRGFRVWRARMDLTGDLCPRFLAFGTTQSPVRRRECCIPTLPATLGEVCAFTFSRGHGVFHRHRLLR